MGLVTIPFVGAAGTNVGAGTDGVLAGAITRTALGKFIRQRRWNSTGQYCYTDDGGLYTDETTPFGETTTNDVEPWPATPAADDAVYFGSALAIFGQVDLDITTAAVGLVATFAWEYWDSVTELWTAIPGIVDGTTAWTVTPAAVVSVTFTPPATWGRNTVDSTMAYWIRCRCTAFTSVTTIPEVRQGWIIAAVEVIREDDTTDINSAGAADVPVFSTYPLLNDASYFSHATLKFCAVVYTPSTARTGTATILWEFWNGTTWATITGMADDGVGFSAGTSTYVAHFEPPATWVANTTANGPNGQAGFFVRARISAFTSMTALPVLTQAWVLPISSTAVLGFTGLSGTITKVHFNAKTISGTTADSKFLIINRTQGTFAVATWTKALAAVTATVSLAVSATDVIALKQIQEDGSTEFADGSIVLEAA